MTTHDELTKECVAIGDKISTCFDQVVYEALKVHLITQNECTSFLSPDAEHMRSCLNQLFDYIRIAIKDDDKHIKMFIAVLHDIECHNLATQLGMKVSCLQVIVSKLATL